MVRTTVSGRGHRAVGAISRRSGAVVPGRHVCVPESARHVPIQVRKRRYGAFDPGISVVATESPMQAPLSDQGAPLVDKCGEKLSSTIPIRTSGGYQLPM